MSAKPTFKIVWLVFVALVLSACGSESDDRNSADNNINAPQTVVTNSLPTADAGVDATLYELSEINLSGQASDIDGSIVSYQWQQTSGLNATVGTNDAAKATFIAPSVKQNTRLTFELTVLDNQGGTATDSVNILVSPNSMKRLDQITFTDAKLSSCVEAVAKTNGWTTVGQMNSLKCRNKGIDSIGGIQNLTSLKFLDLSQNTITILSPINNLTALTQLNLAGNGLVNIDALANLTALAQLNLGAAQQLSTAYNSIRDISPLANLTALTELDLGYNQLSDISGFIDLTSLVKLTLNHNQIRDIEVLYNLANATKINLRDNDNITCAALNELEISIVEGQIERPSDCIFSLDIRIADIQFADQNLKSCVLDTASSEGWITISEMTALACDEQYLTDLSGLQNLKALNYLDLRANQIIDIKPLFELTATANIDLSMNEEIACVRLDALQAVLGAGIISRPSSCAQVTLISDLDFVDPVLEACVRHSAQANQWKTIDEMVTLRCESTTQGKIQDFRGIDQLTALVSVNLKGYVNSDAIACHELDSLNISSVCRP